MSHKFLLDATFHSLLIKIDQELATAAAHQGCCHCGSKKLHQADYPRSPMGLLAQFRDNYESRISWCCGDCRRRTTPPSVRFFGRRWFPAPVFMLICALTLGVSERRCRQIKRHFGVVVSLSTWKRWRRWWREAFRQTAFWQQAKGHLAFQLETEPPVPRELLRTFKGTLAQRMCLLLRFLAPLTGGVLRAV